MEYRPWACSLCSRVPGPTRPVTGTPLPTGLGLSPGPGATGGPELQGGLPQALAPRSSTLKSLWFGAGCYLARELVCLHGFYLKVTEKLKIEEFWLGREHGCSVALATAGSGVLPIQATAKQVGQAQPTQDPLHPCPAHSWALGPAVCPFPTWYKLLLAQGGLEAPRGKWDHMGRGRARL